jgi:hypothetical protein
MHGIEECLCCRRIVLEMLLAAETPARSLMKMRCTDVKPGQYDFDIVKGKA